MITKFSYGTPVETFAVVKDFPSAGHEQLRHFSRKKGTVQYFTCMLGEEDIVYGLGETMRGVNKPVYQL